ncbi:MAG TPA: hypothetical protein VL742_00675 [Casimicrobiaceae bacterium]|nr:hypothetical protein [Casimicrobiaceae bacterium]
MLKRFCLTILLAIFASPAFAIDYSDMWYLPAESGWGVNFTQNDGVIFMTFFLYGTDNEPVWYVAIAYEDASGNFSGMLYSTTGTYFGAPWGGFTSTAGGTASFAPTDASHGTLTYTLNGGPTVVKSIVRQTLTTIDLSGNFTGGQAGGYSGCASAGDNFLYKDTFDLSVLQSSGNVTFTFAYPTLNCTLSGALVQEGQLYRVPSATYQCDDGTNTQASVSEIKKTSQGIEGRFAAPDVGGACREDATFSGVNLE